MARNYKNESMWQREKYTRRNAYIDKDLGNDLRKKLQKNKKPIATWVKECAIEYLKD